MSKLVFELLKALLSLRCPDELSSLENFSHRDCQGVANKSPIKGGKAMKSSHIHAWRYELAMIGLLPPYLDQLGCLG